MKNVGRLLGWLFAISLTGLGLFFTILDLIMMAQVSVGAYISTLVPFVSLGFGVPILFVGLILLFVGLIFIILMRRLRDAQETSDVTYSPKKSTSYRKNFIKASGSGFNVWGRPFKNLEDAKAFLDEQLDGRED